MDGCDAVVLRSRSGNKLVHVPQGLPSSERAAV